MVVSEAQGCRRDKRSRAIPISISTKSWALPDSTCATATFRGRKHESLSESRMREICKSGLMSGSVETEHGAASEAPADERAGNR